MDLVFKFVVIAHGRAGLHEIPAGDFQIQRLYEHGLGIDRNVHGCVITGQADDLSGLTIPGFLAHAGRQNPGCFRMKLHTNILDAFLPEGDRQMRKGNVEKHVHQGVVRGAVIRHAEVSVIGFRVDRIHRTVLNIALESAEFEDALPVLRHGQFRADFLSL